MTRNELISAYESGRINRRALIKGLTAVGLSVTVATSMADKLRAAPLGPTSPSFSAAEQDDTYGPVDSEEDPPPPTTLPNTGIGESSEQSKLIGPIAVIGGAAALVASKMRRTKTDETQ